MPLSLRKNGRTSLFKEVRVFKGTVSEGREWGVGSVVVEFGVFGAPRFSVQRSQNPLSGTQNEPKPKLVSPYIFRWGRGLPHEGVGGQKVRYAPRNQGNQTFLAGYPGILPGYPGGAREVWEKSLGSIFVPYFKTTVLGPLDWKSGRPKDAKFNHDGSNPPFSALWLFGEKALPEEIFWCNDYVSRVVKTPFLVNHGFAWVTPAIFVIFVSFSGFWGPKHLVFFFVCRTQTRHFRRFRQNPLFSAGKTTVSQNHRFNNPECKSFGKRFEARDADPTNYEKVFRQNVWCKPRWTNADK